MNAQDLKNSILQRAIEGKLVPQRKEEGTAKELLAEIRAEKARLIKEKKIKKIKPVPEITDEEKPFDIPGSWEWVRLGEIFLLQSGKNIKAENIHHEQTESYTYPCYGGNGIRGFVDFFNSEGDFPIIGRQGALCGNINRARGKFYATEHAVLTATFANTDVSWACYFLKALNLNQYATATAQPGLAVSKINYVLIPFPPLAEQHRIVAKIEELLPDIDAYDKAQTKLQAIEQRFPDDMKKSLLQYAIEGKLVPQRKEEGTAKDLLAEIRAEKARLVKEKKIKKSKPLLDITDDEKPFDIPDSWEWVRLGDIIELQSGQDFSPSKYSDTDKDGTPYITGASSFTENGVLENRWTKCPKCIATKGDILLVCKGSGYGKVTICNLEEAHIARQIMAIKQRAYLNITYIKFFLMARIKLIKKNGQGVIPGISRDIVLNLLFPLPPLAEQHRIVTKLEELLPLCQQLASYP